MTLISGVCRKRSSMPLAAGVWFALTLFCPIPRARGQSDPLHAWTGKQDKAAVESWVGEHLSKERKLVEQIQAVQGKRTIENTLRSFDDAQNELSLAGFQTYLLYSVAPQKETRDTAQALAQKVQEVNTALALNQEVYKALAALDVSSADAATRHYMERTLLEYHLAGVGKDDKTRAEIKKRLDYINEEGLTFGRNINERLNQVTVKDKSELDGVPADFLARHPMAADRTITLSTEETDFSPVMTYAASDELRKRMQFAYDTRAYPENKAILQEILKTRYEVARLIGYPTFADLATADQMIGSAPNMRKFLDEVDTASRVDAQKEYELILDFVRQKHPEIQQIPQYARFFWEDQYTKTNYHFDSQVVRPYFPYDRVQQGVLDIAAKLFRVSFQPAKDAIVWDPSVTAWDVLDKGKRIGRFYLDMHPRDGKNKWFSSSPVVAGIKGRQLPEGVLICNFPGGTAGDPGLMQYDDVVTFFHEFGHLMHNILGGQQAWSGVSGFATETDFVEAPSQMLEEFFHDPAILRSFAKHYQTNEVLPVELIDKMNRASAFGRAGWVRSQLIYSNYSLDVHDRAPEAVDLDALLKQDFTRFSPYTYLEGNRFYASFGHLVGYTSNYYTYLLDKVIALDFFSQFDQNNLLGGDAVVRYRKEVLEPGGSKAGTELVRDFLGRPQNSEAFKKWMETEFQAKTN